MVLLAYACSACAGGLLAQPRFSQVSETQGAKIRELISVLDDDVFARREKATQELRALGQADGTHRVVVLHHLEQVKVEKGYSLEQERRAQAIRDELHLLERKRLENLDKALAQAKALNDAAEYFEKRAAVAPDPFSARDLRAAAQARRENARNILTDQLIRSRTRTIPWVRFRTEAIRSAAPDDVYFRKALQERERYFGRGEKEIQRLLDDMHGDWMEYLERLRGRKQTLLPPPQLSSNTPEAPLSNLTLLIMVFLVAGMWWYRRLKKAGLTSMLLLLLVVQCTTKEALAEGPVVFPRLTLFDPSVPANWEKALQFQLHHDPSAAEPPRIPDGQHNPFKVISAKYVKESGIAEIEYYIQDGLDNATTPRARVRYRLLARFGYDEYGVPTETGEFDAILVSEPTPEVPPLTMIVVSLALSAFPGWLARSKRVLIE